MKIKHAYFANFICRFGSNQVLVDYLDEIVIPAFKTRTESRKHGKSSYFFYETELVVLEKNQVPPVLAIAGTYIKDTVLSREQTYDPIAGITRDEATMPSAPTAFFLLILNNHKLVYLPETSYAPDLNSFKRTVLHNLKKQHDTFVRGIYSSSKEQSTKITLKSIEEQHPQPSLDIVPITGDEQLEAFVNRYSKLKSVELHILKTNHEMDGATVFQELKKQIEPMEADTSRLKISSKDGLEKQATIDTVKAATKTGNQRAIFRGEDSEGNNLDGDNSNFSISSPVDEIPNNKSDLIGKLYKRYKELVESGVITIRICMVADRLTDMFDRIFEKYGKK